ncbi:alpha- and gamma-adaptin-binding protein p34-like, partial [Tetranychus urticae]|uniref:alpha- and gamma-adaptin-binding protein p34-like n=1 Tax=Tetranychus urticae TaxID=32264 RepID=UPI000D64FCB9
FGNHSFTCYPWHISTKYYEADVHFIEILDCDLISAQFADSIQAIIILLDNNDELYCQKFHAWKPFIDEYDPDIRLLVAEKAINDSFFDRTTCMKWCINNEFELIELDAEIDSEDEYENDFVDSDGIKRIMQALSAHTWPMMEMHETPQYKPSPKFENC